MPKIIIAAPSTDEEEFELPAYSDVGRIIFRILGQNDFRPEDYEIEELGYDGCAFWINEGQGIDFWLNSWLDKGMSPGVYVIENIVGSYTRGTWGFDDDVEEFESNQPRAATPEEIASESLL